MYKFILLFFAVALAQAAASLATVGCGDVTSQGTLVASCSIGPDAASVSAASWLANDNRDILDLSFSGPSASASFSGAYELSVAGVADGWFAPTFTVGNWSDVSLSLDGVAFSAGQGTRLLGFTNGESDFTISVSGPLLPGTGDSVKMALFHMWDESGHSITPDYQLVATTLASPEPSAWLLVATGLSLILAGRRSHRK